MHRNIIGVPSVSNISREDFYDNFVKKKIAVVIKDAVNSWPALSTWNLDYFKSIDSGGEITTKSGDVSRGNKMPLTLSNYVDILHQYERLEINSTLSKPSYLHDVPIFHIYPQLVKDIEPFPLKYFPQWYWEKYFNFIQFFMGPKNSLTPFHFDTLWTHNLFFQLYGRKKFILASADQRNLSYIYDWRWSKVDPLKPDYNQFPLFSEVKVLEAEVGPGDIIYLPPGTLHQVHGLSTSISFNIDWHTPESVRVGLGSVLKGAPLINGYYNLMILLGITLGVPQKIIFPHYRSYLNYIS